MSDLIFLVQNKTGQIVRVPEKNYKETQEKTEHITQNMRVT